MEKMILLKSECTENLRQSIQSNLERYRMGNFSGLLDTITIDIEFDYSALCGIVLPDGDDTKDIENCELVSTVTKHITPSTARDERLWAHLCHGPMLEYTRKRWPIPANDDKAVASIKSHFFAGDKRNLEARNAVSRLYWLALIASRVTDLPIKEVLSLILYRQDVRQNVIERPTVLQAESILIAVIANLKASKAGNEKLYERSNFRKLQGRLNEYCGHIFVESLPKETVKTIVDEMVADILTDKHEVA